MGYITTEVPTINATIYVGLRSGYDDIIFDFDVARIVCQKYCNLVGYCVSFTKTDYIYTNGHEPGLIIGLINYPRFPADRELIKQHAFSIARELQEKLEQYRVSIVMDDVTYMLSLEKEDGD